MAEDSSRRDIQKMELKDMVGSERRDFSRAPPMWHL